MIKRGSTKNSEICGIGDNGSKGKVTEKITDRDRTDNALLTVI